MVKPFLDSNLQTCVLIDGINTHYAFKNLGWAPDYKKLLHYLKEETLLRKVYYFISMDRNEDSSMIKLLDWLDYNGYQVRITEYDEHKRGIEVDLTVEAMSLVEHIDQYILFTGNNLYTPLVKRLDSMGKVVVICSTLLNQRMAGDSIRRAADSFVEIDSMRSIIESSRVNNSYSTVPIGEEYRETSNADDTS